MLAMGVIGSVRGGTKGIFSTRSRSSRSQPPAVALRSQSVSRPLPERLPGPRCFPGVFKPAPGSSAGQDWLPGWGRPSPPFFPPILWIGCLGPGTVAPSGPALSAFSSRRSLG